MKTILKSVAHSFLGIFLFISFAHAQLVSVTGSLKTQFIPGSVDRTVLHEVSFDIAEPISCQGSMVSRLVTLNGPYNLGDREAYLPLNYALLGDNVTLLYAAADVRLDVRARNLRMADGVAACQVDVMSAVKDVFDLYDPPVIDGQVSVALSEVAFRRDFSLDPSPSGRNNLNTLVIDTASSFDCRGNETSTVLMQWRSKRASDLEQGNVLALDALVIGLNKNYLAIEPQRYEDDASLGIQGCVVDTVRSLSAIEDPDEGEVFSGLSFDEAPQYCRDNASEFGLFVESDLTDAQASGFSSGVAACQSAPNDYGLFSGLDIDEAFSAGIAECQLDPSICGLFGQSAVDESREVGLLEGRQSCLDDPLSCGLFTQQELADNFSEGFDTGKLEGVEEGKSVGISQCQVDPSSCGVFGQNDVDNSFSQGLLDGVADGIAQCKRDPSSCDLFSQSQLDLAKADTIEATMRAVMRELPRLQAYASCLRNRQSLICQYRHYAKRHFYSPWNRYKRHF